MTLPRFERSLGIDNDAISLDDETNFRYYPRPHDVHSTPPSVIRRMINPLRYQPPPPIPDDSISYMPYPPYVDRHGADTPSTGSRSHGFSDNFLLSTSFEGPQSLTEYLEMVKLRRGQGQGYEQGQGHGQGQGERQRRITPESQREQTSRRSWSPEGKRWSDSLDLWF